MCSMKQLNMAVLKRESDMMFGPRTRQANVTANPNQSQTDMGYSPGDINTNIGHNPRHTSMHSSRRYIRSMVRVLMDQAIHILLQIQSYSSIANFIFTFVARCLGPLVSYIHEKWTIYAEPSFNTLDDIIYIIIENIRTTSISSFFNTYYKRMKRAIPFNNISIDDFEAGEDCMEDAVASCNHKKSVRLYWGKLKNYCMHSSSFKYARRFLKKSVSKLSKRISQCVELFCTMMECYRTNPSFDSFSLALQDDYGIHCNHGFALLATILFVFVCIVSAVTDIACMIRNAFYCCRKLFYSIITISMRRQDPRVDDHMVFVDRYPTWHPHQLQISSTLQTDQYQTRKSVPQFSSNQLDVKKNTVKYGWKINTNTNLKFSGEYNRGEPSDCEKPRVTKQLSNWWDNKLSSIMDTRRANRHYSNEGNESGGLFSNEGVGSSRHIEGVGSIRHNEGIRSSRHNEGIRSSRHNEGIRSSRHNEGIRSSRHNEGIRSSRHNFNEGIGLRRPNLSEGIRLSCHNSNVGLSRHDSNDGIGFGRRRPKKNRANRRIANKVLRQIKHCMRQESDELGIRIVDKLEEGNWRHIVKEILWEDAILQSLNSEVKLTDFFFSMACREFMLNKHSMLDFFLAVKNNLYPVWDERLQDALCVLYLAACKESGLYSAPQLDDDDEKMLIVDST